MKNVFFSDFLMLSQGKTFLSIGLLLGLFGVMYALQKKKVGFSQRMIIGTGLGLVLGFVVQAMVGFSNAPMEIPFVAETAKWYGLFGNGFIDLIRMLVVPLVMVSIIHVIINMEEGANIGKLTRTTLIVTLGMVAVSAVIGLAVGTLFQVGTGMGTIQGTAEIKEVNTIVDTLRGLLPSNPAKAMG